MTDVVVLSHAREDARHDDERGVVGGDEATRLSHHLEEARLLQVRALAGLEYRVRQRALA